MQAVRLGLGRELRIGGSYRIKRAGPSNFTTQGVAFKRDDL